MSNMQQIHDIGMPIYDRMWSYREDWSNGVTPIAETSAGDQSTVYRFNLCSHTGTYLETSQHKLINDIQLSDFTLADYVRPCLFVSIPREARQSISQREFEAAIESAGHAIDDVRALIVATGWGLHHRDPNYLSDCPFFSKDLVRLLCELNLDLLGVDTPIIDDQQDPFGAVATLFECNPRMLLLAPLVIDPAEVVSGRYFLSANPLHIEGVSASLCRPLLFADGTAPRVKSEQ